MVEAALDAEGCASYSRRMIIAVTVGEWVAFGLGIWAGLTIALAMRHFEHR